MTTNQTTCFTILVLPLGAGLIAVGNDQSVATIVKYQSTGTLDSSFGTNGIKKQNLGGQCWDGERDAGGNILVAGGGGSGAYVARFTSTGALDSGFGSSGSATVSQIQKATDVAVLASGKILFAGEVYNGTDYEFGLAQLDSGGTLDSTFDEGAAPAGVVILPILSGDQKCAALAIQPDDAIVCVGTGAGNYNAFLVRYGKSGSVDTTFGTNGIVTNAGGGGLLQAVLIQPDGKIVVGGSLSGSQFFMARYK